MDNLDDFIWESDIYSRKALTENHLEPHNMASEDILLVARSLSFFALTCLTVGASVYYMVVAKTLPILYFSYWVLLITTVHYALLMTAIVKKKFRYALEDGSGVFYLWKWSTATYSFSTIGVMTVCMIWWARESQVAIKAQMQ